MFWHRLTKLIRIVLSPYLFFALVRGSPATTEHIKVLKRHHFDLIVDVGANRGQFTLIARKLYPQAIIHAFEPLTEPARVFHRILGSDAGVILHPCAIGREKARATMHITKKDHSSSLLPTTETLTAMFPCTAEKGTRPVDVITLSEALGDAAIPAASLLKIDVQGYELEVLKGCEDMLNKFSHLYVECSFIELYQGQALAHQIIAWLEERGFSLSGIYNMYYDRDGSAVYGDFHFSRMGAG